MVGCGNDTIAKINDVKISKDEYNKIASFLYATGYVQEDKNKGINNNILSFIIDNEVAYQDALRENIKVEDIDVNENDKIITLSTCSYEFNDARMVVHGKLLK